MSWTLKASETVSATVSTTALNTHTAGMAVISSKVIDTGVPSNNSTTVDTLTLVMAPVNL